MYIKILPEHLKIFHLRIGTHKLPINNQENSNVPRNEILCTIFDEGVLGDEIHFLYKCKMLVNLRTKYISSCN